MYELIKTKTYQKGERKYAGELGQSRIDKMEGHLRTDPKYNPAHITKLQGEENMYRYTIGGYRVIYEVFDDEVEVLMIKIGPRGDVYKDFE